ncbi:MAG TPA: hypothetical protein PLK55_04300 [archaeon]|mgnify:CR=1 FL=1|nr:hypothetical protein [archaeon]
MDVKNTTPESQKSNLLIAVKGISIYYGFVSLFYLILGTAIVFFSKKIITFLTSNVKVDSANYLTVSKYLTVSNAVIIGGILLSIGLFILFSAIGLWKLKNSARIYLIIVTIFSCVSFFFWGVFSIFSLVFNIFILNILFKSKKLFISKDDLETTNVDLNKKEVWR